MPSRQALIDVSNLSLVEQGRLFKVSGRTVSRWRAHYKLSTPPERLTPEQERRAKVLAEEGMPMQYIAADVGVSHGAIYDRFCPSPQSGEWKRVWTSIRNKPTLLALHREFFPKPVKSKKDRVAA